VGLTAYILCRMRRKAIPTDVTLKVLHEAAFKCANPRCRYPLTLDRHHLDPHSEGGPDTADNLIALCPNCHADHHAGKIPKASLRAWKMLLITINEAYDRQGVSLLLAINKVGELALSGGDCAQLMASNLVDVRVVANGPLVDGWLKGDQAAAIPDPVTTV
jgi:hypothetical protein